MTVPADTLRAHIDYTAWASGRLTEAAASLSVSDLNRDFGTSDKSVLGTLVHVYAADRVWLRRVQSMPTTVFLDPGRDMQMTVLENDWPLLLGEWKQFLSRHTDETVQHVYSYEDMRGNSWQTPLWQIVLHLVNHATHHRGQVSGFLRSMGKNPPALDLIAFYRSLSA